MIRITLLTTGGTIDGADSDKGTVRVLSDVSRWLKTQKNIQINELSLFNKDSREITSSDRKLIVEAVRSCTDDYILISHGTFTIADTGKLLKKELLNLNKTIFLTGSWKPFSENDSDAEFQLSFALSQINRAPNGVYIAMDGKLWDPTITIKKEIGDGKYKLEETDGR